MPALASIGDILYNEWEKKIVLQDFLHFQTSFVEKWEILQEYYEEEKCTLRQLNS